MNDALRVQRRHGLCDPAQQQFAQAAVDAARAAGFAIRAADSYRIASEPAVRVTISALSDDDIDALAAALGEHLGAPRRSLIM